MNLILVTTTVPSCFGLYLSLWKHRLRWRRRRSAWATVDLSQNPAEACALGWTIQCRLTAMAKRGRQKPADRILKVFLFGELERRYESDLVFASTTSAKGTWGAMVMDHREVGRIGHAGDAIYTEAGARRKETGVLPGRSVSKEKKTWRHQGREYLHVHSLLSRLSLPCGSLKMLRLYQ